MQIPIKRLCEIDELSEQQTEEFGKEILMNKVYAKPGLKKAREDRLISQPEMADIIRIALFNEDRSFSYSLYQKIEQGTYAVDILIAQKISSALKIDFSQAWTSTKPK